jgi:hypothetical protein
MAVTITMLPTLDVEPFPTLALVRTGARALAQRKENVVPQGVPEVARHQYAPSSGTTQPTQGNALLLRLLALQPDNIEDNGVLKSEFPGWFRNDTVDVSDPHIDTDAAISGILTMLRQLAVPAVSGREHKGHP